VSAFNLLTVRGESNAFNPDPVNQVLEITAEGVGFSGDGGARTEQLFLKPGRNFFFFRCKCK
jgi:hypothetical protein